MNCDPAGIARPERSMARLESDLADKLNRIGEHLLSAVALAMAAGDDLIEAKARLSHGQWRPWLRTHFPLSERTAQDWMRLSRNPQRAALLEAGSVREALALMAPARPLPPVEPLDLPAVPTTVTVPATLAEALERLRQLADDQARYRRAMRRVLAEALAQDDLDPAGQAWLIDRLRAVADEAQP